MIKVIIFDFDGVIVESIDIKTRAFAKLFEMEDKKDCRRIIAYHLENSGVSRFEKFKYIYKEILKRRLGNDEFKRLCACFAGLVKDEVIKAPFVEGIDSFLRKQNSKYRFFIVSATPQGEIEEIVRRRKIGHFFIGIYGSPTKKSDAAKGILINEGISHASALYIGDSLSDYMAAKENSIRFIARINGNKSEFSEIDCLKIKNFQGLQEIIDESIYKFK